MRVSPAGAPRIFAVSGLLLMLVACSGSAGKDPPTAESLPKTLVVDGVERSFLLHVPPASSPPAGLPLVIALHGLGGQGRTMAELTDLNALATREGFIVAYPNGLERAWIDAGGTSSAMADANVRYIDALITSLDEDYRLDNNRVFATGISNGALFSFHLACQLSDRFAAVGLVAGASISRSFGTCQPEHPVSYIALHGTRDFIVPYDGGIIADGFPEIGYYQSAWQAVELWATANSCGQNATRNTIEDTNKVDGSTIIRHIYTGCSAGTAVELYSIEGAGHTWPGHPRQSPAFGETNLDIDASEVIWEFFKSHPSQNSSQQ